MSKIEHVHIVKMLAFDRYHLVLEFCEFDLRQLIIEDVALSMDETKEVRLYLFYHAPSNGTSTSVRKVMRKCNFCCIIVTELLVFDTDINDLKI